MAMKENVQWDSVAWGIVRSRWEASSLEIPVLNLQYVTWGISYLNGWKPPVTWNHVRIGVIIDRAHESKHRSFVSKVTSMYKDKRLCFQARTIINRVVDYLARLKMRSVVEVTVRYKERRKPQVSDRSGIKTEFSEARFFWKPQNTWRMSTSRDSIQLNVNLFLFTKYGTDRELLLHRLKGVARTIVSYGHQSARMRRMQIGMVFTTYGVFRLTVFSDFKRYKLY